MLDTSSWTLIDLLFALGVVVSITLGTPPESAMASG